MSESILQTEKRCYCTGSCVKLVRHHVMPGIANRKKAEKYGLWVWLNSDYHSWIHSSAPGASEKLKELRADGQRAFEKNHSREEWMEIFHKNYLED